MEGWIKLHRQLEEWQWINKPDMVSLFIYCLIRANHSDCIWQNIEIKRGTFITSPEKLSNKLGIKYQSVRTCLMRLEKTGEINKQSTNKYTIITVNNYDSYQGEQQTKKSKSNKQLTINQQTTNKQLTTDKNEKNNKNENNEKKEDIVETSSTDIKKDILRARARIFETEVKSFTEYPKEMLREFLLYWIEPNKSFTKMRFEQQKTWELKLRLIRWASNQKNFKKTEVSSHVMPSKNIGGSNYSASKRNLKEPKLLSIILDKGKEMGLIEIKKEEVKDEK